MRLGLVALVVTLGLGPVGEAALVGHWVADDWSGSGNWLDRVSSLVAAPVGDPTVSSGWISLDGNDAFDVTAANNPATGASNFTVFTKFKTTTGGVANNTGGSWWSNSGIVGGEVVGNPNDWGLMLLADGRGQGAFRGGSAQGSNVIDGNTHTLALTWSGAGDDVGRWPGSSSFRRPVTTSPSSVGFVSTVRPWSA
jgi:hypothetical protein